MQRIAIVLSDSNKAPIWTSPFRVLVEISFAGRMHGVVSG